MVCSLFLGRVWPVFARILISRNVLQPGNVVGLFLSTFGSNYK